MSKIIPINLGAKRKHAELTQEQLGGILNLSNFYVLRIEKGKLTTPFHIAVKLVNVFGPLIFKDSETGECYQLTKILK